MNNRYKFTTATTICGLVGAVSIASTPIVYPAKNQTPAQQQKDEGECAAWAKQTTGIDPVALASAPVAVPPTAATQPAPAQSAGPQGERVRGAAKGAAAGAIAGEIVNNDADEGAAAGAAVGAVAGGSRARRDRRAQQEQVTQQQQQATQEQQAAQQQAEAKRQEQLATYERASAACLEGRGYVLK